MMRVARQRQSHPWKAGLAPPQGKSAATPKNPRWRGYSRDDEHSNHSLKKAPTGKGCKEEEGRGRSIPRSATAALPGARQNEGTDASWPSLGR
jgi:hypothetical protein